MRLPAPPAQANAPFPSACGSCTHPLFLRSSLGLLPYGHRLIRPPCQANPPPLGLKHLFGRLEVLADHCELTALVELDHISGHHPDVDDIANPSSRDVRPRFRSLLLAQHPDLLWANGEMASPPLQEIGDADEAGHEVRGRLLVHVDRGP